MLSPTTLQNATAYNAADLNGSAVDVGNFPVVAVWFTPSGSYNGTATFQVSPDDATWFVIDGYLVSTIETPINAVATPAANALYLVPVPANMLFRVVMSGGSQGALTVAAARTYYPI